MPVEIVGPVDTNVQDCERILRALPAYFGIEEALLQYLKDIVDMTVDIMKTEDGYAYVDQ